MNTWLDISSYYHVYYVGYNTAHTLHYYYVYIISTKTRTSSITGVVGDYRVWQQIMQTQQRNHNFVKWEFAAAEPIPSDALQHKLLHYL